MPSYHTWIASSSRSTPLEVDSLCPGHLLTPWYTKMTFLKQIILLFLFLNLFIFIQLQLSAFSPLPSTPPQPVPPPFPTSTLPLDFVLVSICLKLCIQWLPPALGRSPNTLAYLQGHTEFRPLLPTECNF